MNAAELYRAGRLDEAVDALNQLLRLDPADSRARTFLFELLCFQGEFGRAEKQLGVLARGGKESEMGALLYRTVLAGEETRRQVFEQGRLPPQTAAFPPARGGTLNGESFSAITDADPRIGTHLEAFVQGQYRWVPFAHLESVQTQPPQRLRDLLWIPAILRFRPEHQDLESGEALLPVLTPLAYRHEDPAVRLGRATHFQESEAGDTVPVGQKLLQVDDREVPILDLRELMLSDPADA